MYKVVKLNFFLNFYFIRYLIYFITVSLYGDYVIALIKTVVY